MGSPHIKRALNLSEPMRGLQSSEAKLLTATPNGQYVVELKKRDGSVAVYVVDKLGCEVNTGTQKIWNVSHFEKAKRGLGETIYSLRLSAKNRSHVIKGTIKAVERNRYLVQIPGTKNGARTDGYFVIGSGSAYGTLDEIGKRLDRVLDDYNKMLDAEQPARLKKVTTKEEE